MNTNTNLTSSNSGQAPHHSHLLNSHHVHHAPLVLAPSSVPPLTSNQFQTNSMKSQPHHQHHHHHHNHVHSHNLAGLSYAKSNVANRSDSSDHHHPTNNASDLSANVSSYSPLSCSYSSHHFNFLNGSLLLFILDQIDFYFLFISFLILLSNS